MKYLVVSADALKRSIRSSEHFPCVVNAHCDASPEQIIASVFSDGFRPRDNKQYVVVPMDNAVKVTFKPKRDYDVLVEDY